MECWIDLGPQPWPCPLHLADHSSSLAECGASLFLVQCEGCLGQTQASIAPASLLTSSMSRLTGRSLSTSGSEEGGLWPLLQSSLTVEA